MRRGHTYLVLLAAVIGMTGCVECTDLGCPTGLFVTVTDASGNQLTTFSGTAVVDGASLNVQCSSGGGGAQGYDCTFGELEILGRVEHVSLELDAGSLHFSGELQPQYKPVYASGEECGVTCRQASWTVVAE